MGKQQEGIADKMDLRKRMYRHWWSLGSICCIFVLACTFLPYLCMLLEARKARSSYMESSNGLFILAYLRAWRSFLGSSGPCHVTSHGFSHIYINIYHHAAVDR